MAILKNSNSKLETNKLLVRITKERLVKNREHAIPSNIVIIFDSSACGRYRGHDWYDAGGQRLPRRLLSGMTARNQKTSMIIHKCNLEEEIE